MTGKYTFKVIAKDAAGNITNKALAAKADFYISIYRTGKIDILSEDSITVFNAGWSSDELVGMELNPNIEQGNTFRVISNTSNTLIVDNSKMDLNDAAEREDTFWLIRCCHGPEVL